jgi:hypothetical protein
MQKGWARSNDRTRSIQNAISDIESEKDGLARRIKDARDSASVYVGKHPNTSIGRSRLKKNCRHLSKYWFLPHNEYGNVMLSWSICIGYWTF